MVAVLFFGGSYWAISRAFDTTIRDAARENASVMAKTTFVSMYELMSNGWKRKQVENFLQGVRQASNGSKTSVDIYRAPVVEALFGKIEQPALDELLQRAVSEKKAQEFSDPTFSRYVFPLRAEVRCVACHVNAKVGDVLGVIEVKQNIADVVAQARGEFFFALGVLVPLAGLLALSSVWWVNRRLEDALRAVETEVSRVNAVSDLCKLELQGPSGGFEEVDRLYAAVQELATKLRAVAVDKDMLTFEIGLLEKFVITSDVIRDWREYVNNLVVEINKVMSAHVLFSIFQIDEELFDLEIFWYDTPTSATQHRVETYIREELKGHSRFSDLSTVNINHHMADHSGNALELGEDELRLRVKSFFVDSPKIGGIVGIGVQADDAEDDTRRLVLDSVLSTLLNVVGSVKAIYKYTRDMEYYATRDPLTDLYNQRVFWELLGHEIERDERNKDRFGVLLVDLDNFKLINDNYGHAVGDRFLQQFADEVRKVLRGGDIFARYGGDEFVLMLPEADVEQVSVIAERILQASRQTTVVTESGEVIHGTASIGMAIYPDHATEAKDLFLFADNMMYKAKAEGKERVAIPTSEDVMAVFKDVSQKSVLILSAIEERKLVPYFQPLLDIKADKVMGYEVLSRIEVDGQVMRADEFVEIAEKIGVIHRMDCVIIEQALDRLHAVGHDGYIFLNLSPRALVLNEFARSVRSIVANSGIANDRIVFEITERDTVKNISLLERFLNDLKFDGFGLAIDDFGSGFSSFHYLRRFPVDFLKVEGDFIMNILKSSKDRAFVNSMQSLAHELNIKVIGEFVEDEEVLQELARMGMDIAQGYHIGRPARDILRSHWRQS
jgi:diguanylate cyclase (GGDEF)-like protein